MKTKMKFFILLFLSLNFGYTFAQEEISKEDAFSWMQGKVNSFSYSKYHAGGLTYKGYTDDYSYEMQYDVSNCSVKITETYKYIKSNNNTRSDYDTKTTYEFSIGDIKSIEDTDGSSYNTRMFLIKTYNDKKVIVRNGDNIQNTLKIRYTKLGDIEGQPERFLKAFRKAMELCGAKKEMF